MELSEGTEPRRGTTAPTTAKAFGVTAKSHLSLVQSAINRWPRARGKVYESIGDQMNSSFDNDLSSRLVHVAKLGKIRRNWAEDVQNAGHPGWGLPEARQGRCFSTDNEDWPVFQQPVAASLSGNKWQKGGTQWPCCPAINYLKCFAPLASKSVLRSN
ncbi:unnamed protein product [Protopolystoma xenopodis]|uniref:Uncharacterized protein n=1 Tax=Protopolystoma xenopodis TaxID=117903 RepID=A0A3S4ZY82_9PLAT|nr:unnamed protein product [Protopolystoma xenopodis]